MLTLMHCLKFKLIHYFLKPQLFKKGIYIKIMDSSLTVLHETYQTGAIKSFWIYQILVDKYNNKKDKRKTLPLSLPRHCKLF